jgi:hypothetical protein
LGNRTGGRKTKEPSNSAGTTKANRNSKEVICVFSVINTVVSIL